MIRLLLRPALIVSLICAGVLQVALALGNGLPSDVIVYTLQKSYSFGDLYLTDLRTLNQFNLTHTPTLDEGHPLWSPDSRLAYYRGDTTASSPFICIFDEKTQCYGTNDNFGSTLRWTPDGRKIVYTDTSNVFHFIDLDSGASQNNDLGVRPFYWNWSPDGSRFLVTGENPNPAPEDCCAIYLAKGDLSDLRIVYHGNLRITAAPSWSRDSKQIVFAASDGLDPSHLYLLDADSAKIRTLSYFPDENPTWSPDGTQIAFISDRSGSLQLYLMSAAGTSQRIVSEIGSWSQLQYIWSPDGSRILFMGDRPGAENQLFVLDLKSKHIQSILSGDGRKSEFAWRP